MYDSKLSQLINETDQYMVSCGYTESAMKRYRYVWEQLLAYAQKNGINEFSIAIGEKFALERFGIKSAELFGEKNSDYQNSLLRALRTLSDYQLHRTLADRPKRADVSFPQQFDRLFSGYLNEYAKQVSQNTVERSRWDFVRFARYLDAHGISDFAEVTVNDIHSYIRLLQQYSQKTISDAVKRISALCKYAYKEGCHHSDLSLQIHNVRYVRNRFIPSTFSQDEIRRILAAVDRNNPIGKRDYAILLLAARLGIRAGDIRRLKLSDLHWESNQIKFVQQKTLNPVVLPLLEDVGLALIDYLQNGRPHTLSDHIFIDHRAPYREFSEHNSMYRIMNKYIAMAGIRLAPERQRGLHALRHSLATSLLEENIPLPIISEILGHVDTNTTKQYLKVSLSALRCCALEVLK